MALPKIDVPVYEYKIPSSGKTIRVRPFNVKEEKLLLMAAESEKFDEVVATVKQVINNCIVEGDFNVDKAPYFDVDFIFIFLRAKSIGESQDIRLTCNNVVKKKVCGNVFNAKLDVANVEMVRDDISPDIKFDADTGVKMKWATYSIVKKLDSTPDIDKKTMLIVHSIDHVYDKNGVHSAKDYTIEELKEFIESLTEANYKKMEAFVDSAPVFVAKIDETCSKCGFEHHVRYSDFLDFFI